MCGAGREGDGWEYFIQQLINGVTLGAIYGLIAIGYTMVYGVVGMINFAHGEIYMVGAFIAAIAFMVLQAIGISSVGVLFLIALPVTRVPDRVLRLDRRARRLSAAARLVEAGADHLRDRHVDLPAEFRPDHPGRAHPAGAGRPRRRYHRCWSAPASPCM